MDPIVLLFNTSSSRWNVIFRHGSRQMIIFVGVSAKKAAIAADSAEYHAAHFMDVRLRPKRVTKHKEDSHPSPTDPHMQAMSL